MNSPIYESVIADQAFDPELVPLTSSRHERMVNHTIWLNKTVADITRGATKKRAARKTTRRAS